MRPRIWRATLLAILTLGGAVAAADATTLSYVVTTFRATWNPVTFEALGVPVRCALTLEGSFAEHTFAKVAGTRIGSVTRASIAGCSEGTATVLTGTLPWDIHYGSFSGALPNITSNTLRLVGASISATPRGFSACLARTTVEQPLGAIVERDEIGQVSGLRLDERSEIRLTGGFCFGSAHASGTGSMKRLGETTNGLVVLLGLRGTTLDGATEEERGGADGIRPVVIPDRQWIGAAGIRNRGIWYQNRIKRIQTVGGHQANFSIVGGEMNACRLESRPGARDETVLAVGGPSCNVRVQVDGTARPRETNVEITYEWSGLWASWTTESFHVRAER